MHKKQIPNHKQNIGGNYKRHVSCFQLLPYWRNIHMREDWSHELSLHKILPSKLPKHTLPLIPMVIHAVRFLICTIQNKYNDLCKYYCYWARICTLYKHKWNHRRIWDTACSHRKQLYNLNNENKCHSYLKYLF